MSGPVHLRATCPRPAAWALAEIRGGVALPVVGVPGGWVATGGAEPPVILSAGPAATGSATPVLAVAAISLRDAMDAAACAGLSPVYRSTGPGADALAFVEFHVGGTAVHAVVPADVELYRAWADRAVTARRQAA